MSECARTHVRTLFPPLRALSSSILPTSSSSFCSWCLKVTGSNQSSSTVTTTTPTRSSWIFHCQREQTNISIMSRKFFVGGNWKMNGVKKEIDDIVAFLKAGPLDPNVGTCQLFHHPKLSYVLLVRRKNLRKLSLIFWLHCRGRRRRAVNLPGLREEHFAEHDRSERPEFLQSRQGRLHRWDKSGYAPRLRRPLGYSRTLGTSQRLRRDRCTNRR